MVGSTGQIGTVLIETLCGANRAHAFSDPIQVFGLARSEAPAPHSSHFLQGSVTDPSFVQSLPDFDHIIYVAGTASDYLARRKETIDTQVVGLEAFLNRFAGCRSFVYISSARVYGRLSDGAPITEDSLACIPPMHTDNIYDSAKRLGESLCLLHARSGHVHAVVARLTNIYGAQDAQRSATAITDFARQAAETGAIQLKGNPESVRNWTCVIDIAQGILRALLLGAAGEAYNIGSAEHLSSRELAAEVAVTFSRAVEVQPPKEALPLSLQTISIERARRDLGYSPVFTFTPLAPVVVERALRNSI